MKMTWDHTEAALRLGLRREAQRHAALAHAMTRAHPHGLRTPESGVAAPALPPQSKTSRKLPAAPSNRGCSII
jgi:hypothetical protein